MEIKTVDDLRHELERAYDATMISASKAADEETSDWFHRNLSETVLTHWRYLDKPNDYCMQ